MTDQAPPSRPAGETNIVRKAFPLALTIEPDVKILLHADGSFDGDLEALEAAMPQMNLGNGMTEILVWLVLHAMRNQKVRNQKGSNGK